MSFQRVRSPTLVEARLQLQVDRLQARIAALALQAGPPPEAQGIMSLARSGYSSRWIAQITGRGLDHVRDVRAGMDGQIRLPASHRSPPPARRPWHTTAHAASPSFPPA